MTEPVPTRLKPRWTEQVFGAKSVTKGGVIHRSIRDVEREIGRANFELEVRRRGYHLIESDTQFIVVCNTGQIRLIC